MPHHNHPPSDGPDYLHCPACVEHKLDDILDNYFRHVLGDDYDTADHNDNDDDDPSPTATTVLVDYVLNHADQLDADLVDLARHGVLVIDHRLTDHFHTATPTPRHDRATHQRANEGATGDPLT